MSQFKEGAVEPTAWAIVQKDGTVYHRFISKADAELYITQRPWLLVHQVTVQYRPIARTKSANPETPTQKRNREVREAREKVLP